MGLDKTDRDKYPSIRMNGLTLNETRAVDMAIATLRKKIESKASQPRLIVTVKGVGYRWGGAADA